MNLIEFIRESNAIESIHREPTPMEIQAHEHLLSLPLLDIESVRNFVNKVAAARLRDKIGLNVRIWDHYPPKGSPDIDFRLRNLLIDINCKMILPFEAHRIYETLHPFTDGNGRSGRAIWLWHMAYDHGVPYTEVIRYRGFLHSWYYQSLAESRK